MKLLIGSLVMAFACVCCSTTDLTIEEVASGQHKLQIIKLPSDQQELRDSIESPFVQNYDYPTESFELIGSTAKTYNDFILKIRNALKGPDAKFNIPMMRFPDTITDSNRFLPVKLSSKEQKYSTTLAVRVSDAYMVGYCCGKYDEKAKKDRLGSSNPKPKYSKNKINYSSMIKMSLKKNWVSKETMILLEIERSHLVGHRSIAA